MTQVDTIVYVVCTGQHSSVPSVYASKEQARQQADKHGGTVYPVPMDTDSPGAPVSAHGHQWKATRRPMLGLWLDIVRCERCETAYSLDLEEQECQAEQSERVVQRKAMEAEEAKKRAKLRKIEKDRKRITALINRARSRRGEPPLPP